MFKVYRGKKHYQDTGRVIEFNGEDEMGFYEEDECNAYYGTDQTVFPAFMKPEEGVGAFEPLICRTLVSQTFCILWSALLLPRASFC